MDDAIVLLEDFSDVSLEDRIGCVKRELAMRASFYPRQLLPAPGGGRPDDQDQGGPRAARPARGAARPGAPAPGGRAVRMTLLIEHAPTARDRRLYSPQMLAALDLSPCLPRGIDYALVTAKAGGKPWAFDDLPALARRIHRDRAGEALQLRPVRIRFRDRPRDAVQVLALDQLGGRVRLIGYAWICGRSWQALRAALDAADASGGHYEGVG